MTTELSFAGFAQLSLSQDPQLLHLRMDPGNPTRRSPPQPVLNIIESTLKRYRILTAKIKSKRAALQRIELGPPRSVKTKISLNVSKDLDGTDQGKALRAQFDAQLAENETALAAIIRATTVAELEQLERELPLLADTGSSEISDFYKDVHTLLFQEGPDWDSVVATGSANASMAYTDFVHAQGLLYTRLTQLRYDLTIEQVITDRAKAAKEAKRAAAMDVESTTPVATSVQELVQERIQKELGPLKKQVARLKEALNDSAGRPRGTDRRKKTAKPQQQKSKANAKGKAGASGAAKSGKPPTKSKQGNKNKPKRANSAKGKTQSK